MLVDLCNDEFDQTVRVGGELSSGPVTMPRQHGTQPLVAYTSAGSSAHNGHHRDWSERCCRTVVGDNEVVDEQLIATCIQLVHQLE